MLLHVALPRLQAAMLEHTGNDGSGGREPRPQQVLHAVPWSAWPKR
jgi:hypothetical protein